MNKQHFYNLCIEWTGNVGTGTAGYKSYERSHTLKIDEKPDIMLSADPAFRGDNTRYNPEELLLASLASCHMLWFLHLCSDKGIIVTAYTDHPTGIMEETQTGSGRFVEVTLRPHVTVQNQQDQQQLSELHKKSRELCFIANSVNFPVKHEPVFHNNTQAAKN